jgi:hypothetical protein
MDAELLTRRKALYIVMGEYYCAIPECYETTTPQKGKAVSEDIFLSAVGAYEESLSHLLYHLTTLEQTPSVLGETKRTRRLIDLLGREVRATRRFISLCSVAPALAGELTIFLPEVTPLALRGSPAT